MDCDTLNDLTMSHTQFNRFEAPITADTDPGDLEQELDLLKNTFGDDDPAVADCLTKLADLFCRKGDFSKVEPLLLEALSIRRLSSGPEHAAVATDLKNLGRLYYFQGRYTTAEPIFKRALLIREKLFGKGHPKVMDMAKWYAKTLRKCDRVKQAEVLEQYIDQVHDKLAAVANAVAARTV